MVYIVGHLKNKKKGKKNKKTVVLSLVSSMGKFVCTKVTMLLTTLAKTELFSLVFEKLNGKQWEDCIWFVAMS